MAGSRVYHLLSFASRAAGLALGLWRPPVLAPVDIQAGGQAALPARGGGTPTAGGDARHRQRAAPFEPPLAQHCPANSANDAEETAEDDDGGSQRLEIGGFHLRKRDVSGDADHDDGAGEV